VPTEINLKDPRDFVFIGRRVARKDTHAKTTGTARFTLDVKLPSMLTALVAHPLRFGARLGQLDASAARKVSGVADVIIISTGVAVVEWAGDALLLIPSDDASALRDIDRPGDLADEMTRP